MQESQQAPISAAQAAEILGVDATTVHRMIKRGTLPAHKLNGRTGAYVLDRAAVEALLTPAGVERSAS